MVGNIADKILVRQKGQLKLSEFLKDFSVSPISNRKKYRFEFCGKENPHENGYCGMPFRLFQCQETGRHEGF